MLIFCQILPVLSSFISSTSLSSCLSSGTSLNCTKELSITLSIESSQVSGSESLEATISSVQGPNISEPLQYPLKVTVSKSAVKARYPLSYLQDFNNKPTELLIPSTLFSCEDGANSNSPTCGWKYDSQGNRIWDSQGYCCDCSFTDFLGLGQNDYERGFACEAFNLGTNSATAFCLVWDELWYSSYEVMQYQISYEITVTITVPNAQGNYSSTNYILSPSEPILKAPQAVLSLIGDFAPFSPPPDFSSSVLFTASSPPSSYIVQIGTPYWMIIDKSQISFDGSQCNLIGTSYSAFDGQSNKCNMQVGSCFKNQLNDFHNSDVTRLSNNETPLYFVSRYGNFSLVEENNIKYLELNVFGSYPSMVNIQLNADNLKFIESVSKGVIDKAEILNFEALTLNGVLLVQVTNIGNIQSQFELSVSCNNEISAIPADPLSLGIMQSSQVKFSVYVTNTNSQHYLCNVTLFNSIGEIDDFKNVTFNTSSVVTNQGTEGGTGNTPNGFTSNNKTNANLDCDVVCSTWYNLICFLAQGCWGKFLEFFGIVIGIVVAFLSVKFVMRRYGFFCHKCCPKFKEKKQENTYNSDQSCEENKENLRRCEERKQKDLEKENKGGDRLNKFDMNSVDCEKEFKCYLNLVEGNHFLKISEPISIEGSVLNCSKGYFFSTKAGKRIPLSSNDIRSYISILPKYPKVIADNS